MDLAWLSEVTGSEQVLRVLDGEANAFDVAEGDALPWAGSFCTRVLDGRLPSLVPNADRNPVAAALPIREQLGIGSYVGSPVRLPDGTLYGMLCCISRGAHTELKDDQVHLLEALAASLGEALAHEAVRRAAPAAVLQRIQAAIRGDGLRVAIQPIVGLSTMRPVGVEALTRFDLAPSRPDLWFAEAAELGLELALEMACIKRALQLLDELPPALYLSINASPSTLRSPELLEALSAVDPRRVAVELTEHSSVAEYDALLESLDLLRRRGVRIAVDDAGAGYASFRHILSVRPDIIKFDREIVTGVDVDPARRALVSALVSSASQLEATLVAEGIETVGELDTLSRLGVTCGQGYHLARPGPLPVPEITARPTSLRRTDAGESPPADPDDQPLEEAVNAILREVVAHTRLEASYLSLWDPRAETLERRIVYDPQRIGMPVGQIVPWRETPCYRCREAGILWTADLQKDLAHESIGSGADLRTFISIPVLDPSGEMIGTLCAADRQARYLSDPVVEQVERLSRKVAGLLARPGPGAGKTGRVAA